MGLIFLKAENSRADGTVKADFEDSSSLIFSGYYLPEGVDLFLWETGRKLSSGEEDACRFAAACYRAEKAAVRLIARAEQNSLTLAAKLERRGFKAVIIKAVISHLLEKNLLDDERYAERWLRSRLSTKKSQSPRSLRFSLGKKGIDRHSSQNALEKTLDPETEFNLLLNFVKHSGFSGKNGGGLRSRLKYEGFSYEVLERYFDLQ